MNECGKAPASPGHFLIEKEALPILVSPKFRIYPVLEIVVFNMMPNYIASPLGLSVPTGVGVLTMRKRKIILTS